MRGFFTFTPRTSDTDDVFAITGRALAFATHFEKHCAGVEIYTSAREAAAQVPLGTANRDTVIFEMTLGAFRRSLGQRPETLARRYEQLLGGSPEQQLRAGAKARNAIAHDIGDSYHADEEARRLLLKLIGLYIRQIAAADGLVALLTLFEEAQAPSTPPTSPATPIARWRGCSGPKPPYRASGRPVASGCHTSFKTRRVGGMSRRMAFNGPRSPGPLAHSPGPLARRKPINVRPPINRRPSRPSGLPCAWVERGMRCPKRCRPKFGAKPPHYCYTHTQKAKRRGW